MGAQSGARSWPSFGFASTSLWLFVLPTAPFCPRHRMSSFGDFTVPSQGPSQTVIEYEAGEVCLLWDDGEWGGGCRGSTCSGVARGGGTGWEVPGSGARDCSSHTAIS